MRDPIHAGKVAFFLAISVLFFPLIIYSQPSSASNQNNSGKDYWSIEYSGGLSFSLIDKTEKMWYIRESDNGPMRAGWNTGLDLMGGVDSTLGIVFTVCYTSLFTDHSGYDNYSFLELTFGPRFYKSLGKQKYFIEAGLGNYMAIKSTKPYRDHEGWIYGGSDSPYPGLGFSFGAGTIFNLTDNMGLLLKCKIRYALPMLKSLLFAGVQTGLAFGNSSSNRKLNPSEYEKDRVWSFTLSGGMFYPVVSTYGDYQTSGLIGIELAKSPWRKVEIFGSMNYSYVVPEVIYYSADKLTLTTFSVGPRFFSSGNNTKAFIEAGGVLAYYTTEFYTSRDVFTTGINAGTGVNQKLYKNIRLMLKANSHFLISVKYYPAVYFTTSAGLRMEI